MKKKPKPKRSGKCSDELIHTVIELPPELGPELKKLSSLLHKLKDPRRTKEQVSRELEAVMKQMVGCSDDAIFEQLQMRFSQLISEYGDAK